MTNSQQKAKVAVAVPIYRDLRSMPENDIKALNRISQVLSERDIFLIHPPSIDIQEYKKFMEPLVVYTICVPPVYFGNSDASNRMLTSAYFYNLFASYDFLLLHHTDAYVFADELDHWCSLGLDYIGAPWLVGNNKPVFPLRFEGVGNGGLSLRRIRSFRKITKSRTALRLHYALCKIRRFLEGEHYPALRHYLGINLIVKSMKWRMDNEDVFWGVIAPKTFEWFKVAEPEQALKFSFEVMPRKLSELNNNQLPFGCHAWEKHDPDFWKPFII